MFTQNSPGLKNMFVNPSLKRNNNNNKIIYIFSPYFQLKNLKKINL